MHAGRAAYHILRVMTAMFAALGCCMYCMYCMLLLPLIIPDKNVNSRRRRRRRRPAIYDALESRGTHTRNTTAPGSYNSKALIDEIVSCRLVLCYCMTPLHTHTHTHAHTHARTHARAHNTLYTENKTCHRDGKILDFYFIFRRYEYL